MLRGVSNFPTSGGGIGLKSAGVLAQSAVPSSVTGTVSETALATVAVPANTLGLNGRLRIGLDFTATNNADVKTLRVKFGGGVIGAAESIASTPGGWAEIDLANENASNVQYGSFKTYFLSIGFGQQTNSLAIDTTQAQTLLITGQLGTSTDTITLTRYTVEIINP